MSVAQLITCRQCCCCCCCEHCLLPSPTHTTSAIYHSPTCFVLATAMQRSRPRNKTTPCFAALSFERSPSKISRWAARPLVSPIYRQHCAQRKPAGISFTQRPILRFFAQQGRHVALMGVKFGTEEGTFGPLLRAKFHLRSPPPCQISPPSVQRQGRRTPKIEIFTQI